MPPANAVAVTMMLFVKIDGRQRARRHGAMWCRSSRRWALPRSDPGMSPAAAAGSWTAHTQPAATVNVNRATATISSRRSSATRRQ